MVTETQRSGLVDPFDGHCGLSMFPRTFRDSVNVPKSNETDDVEFIHKYMKSMALKSPDKLIEQAKVILDGGSELLSSKVASSVESENKGEPVAPKAKENPQERRPGLGRKRAQFSLKTSSMQPSISMEPSLDIAQLKDPEEFFLAYEKFENARKELERQRGGVMADVNEYDSMKTARVRRPGILGKSYSYKHHNYSSVLSQNDNLMMSSQETLQHESVTPHDHSLQPEESDQNVESRESELSGSPAKTENRVNELLDELLSRNCENLDGDGALSFLQERLQIKPIAPEKLCIPDLHDIGRSDFITSGEKLPKPRNTLSDIQNLVNGISRRTPAKRKQGTESPLNSLASPTPPKSPFASISLLKRRILQSSLSSDPFSALNVDQLPDRAHSPVECAGEGSGLVDSRKKESVSERLKSVSDKNNLAAASMEEPETALGDSTSVLGMSLNDNAVSGGSYSDLECFNGSSNTGEGHVDENVNRYATDHDDLGDRSHEVGEHAEIMPQEAVPSAQDDDGGNCSSEPWTDFATRGLEENVENIPQEAVPPVLTDINIEDSTVEKLNSSLNHFDQSTHAAVENHAMELPSRTSDTGPEQNFEKSQEQSSLSLDEQNKVKGPSRGGRKRKAASSRKSLAGAGTFFESGVRRSSRIKMRPLEYWKGERFLYGRIHESLTTVIGVKYVSPAKGDGKSSLRVKSYVPDKYKELVELAALH